MFGVYSNAVFALVLFAVALIRLIRAKIRTTDHIGAVTAIGFLAGKILVTKPVLPVPYFYFALVVFFGLLVIAAFFIKPKQEQEDKAPSTAQPQPLV